ncbi:MAG: nucleotide exchange factor GrpE [Candidatus Wildermuthbacteria bacterium RIFCSPHIGHO2_01_FULL_49_22b]|uniref:Protein GrpE n=1 Tax=Candidatus Wildermuthbacteria bacterium RIFCSPHIGHO2_01_FULL_49_22b TaxID=1802448 RepID=A0A1G2QWG6_9BACT|nr:MAG: nucleotide exchange factor GrpE [Candidatus Wildermuthbacteria bacterium RIFCSPHIGHO2_01_FULL_49_22b]
MDQDKTEEPQKRIEELEKERDEFLAGWQRARADFLNYKKEEASRMKGWMEYAEQEFLYRLLPILDNLERAEREVKEEKDSKLAQGFLHIGKQLRDILKSHGVTEIETEGKKFDPALHEAVGSAKGNMPIGYVADVKEKGYMYRNTLLRPAKVMVITETTT